MPRAEQSLRITDLYRLRLLSLADRVETLVLQGWQQNVALAALDRTHALWLQRTVLQLEQAQRAGVRLTAAYLSSFIASELGRRAVELPVIDETGLVGLAADGRPITEALAPTAITVKTALADGKPASDALQEGARRATRLAASAVTAAPRAALEAQIQTHPLITGWRRVTHGGCGACLAAAAHGYDRHQPLRVHDHCHCTAEPVIRGVPDSAPRATGPEIFHRMTAEQQDAALGANAAKLVRQGAIAWPDLIAPVPMTIGPDGITQAPLQALAAH